MPGAQLPAGGVLLEKLHPLPHRETAGPIYDRTAEHLGSDVAVREALGWDRSA